MVVVVSFDVMIEMMEGDGDVGVTQTLVGLRS